LALEETDKPSVNSGEVLIKVEACGVCHTDLHLIDGEWFLPKLPIILGHEVVGIVEEVAPGVDSIKVGERVGVPWIQWTCSVCEYCLTGNENSCSKQIITGYSVDGGYAEYMKAPAAYIAKVPDTLSPEEAAPIFCAGVTSYRALKLSGTKLGDRVAVFGVGGLGQMAIQIAQAMGASVIAVDVSEEKLEWARQLGAETALYASEETERTIQRLGGAHTAISLVPTPQAVHMALSSLKKEGMLVVVGFPVEPVSLSMYDIVRRRLKIAGSGVGTRQDLREVLNLAAQGKIKVLVESHPMEATASMLEKLRHGQIKGRAVIVPH
jgi:propanol-preferring alcohol dehydrogenase